MQRSIIFFFLISTGLSLQVPAQKPSSDTRYVNDYMVLDSMSTLIIPTHYNEALFTSNKMAGSGEYYANLIFYEYKTDSITRLFDHDVYIKPFYGYDKYEHAQSLKASMSSEYIFYRCYTIDRNKNGKIDHGDPMTLYVSDRHGKNLTALTTENQNVVDVDLFDKYHFAMIRIQRDSDNDGNFEADTDRDYYFVKLDLKTRKFGPKIEAR